MGMGMSHLGWTSWGKSYCNRDLQDELASFMKRGGAGV